MALHFCSCLLGGEAPGAAGSDQHAMGSPGVGVELEDGAQRLMPWLGARGLAHMHSATVAPLHGDGDPSLDACLSVVFSNSGMSLKADSGDVSGRVG